MSRSFLVVQFREVGFEIEFLVWVDVFEQLYNVECVALDVFFVFNRVVDNSQEFVSQLIGCEDVDSCYTFRVFRVYFLVYFVSSNVTKM